MKSRELESGAGSVAASGSTAESPECASGQSMEEALMHLQFSIVMLVMVRPVSPFSVTIVAKTCQIMAPVLRRRRRVFFVYL